MNKIPYPSQNTEAKTLPADVCIFGHFGWLSPAAVYSADCRFDSGVKWWIHVSSIVTYLHKNFFFFFFFLLRWVAFTLNTAFSLWWIHCLLISSTPLLSHATSIYDRPKWVLVFFRTTDEFGWPECSASLVSVQPHLKSAYNLLTVVSDGPESE